MQASAGLFIDNIQYFLLDSSRLQTFANSESWIPLMYALITHITMVLIQQPDVSYLKWKI